MISKTLNNKLNRIIKKYKLTHQSPYSCSYYNSDNITWGYKPEGSLRLSDHWNFVSQGETHCKLANTNEYTQKWLLCEYRNGYYHVVMEVFNKEELELEERCIARLNKKQNKQIELRKREQLKIERLLEKGSELNIKYKISKKSGRYFNTQVVEEKCFCKGCWAYTTNGKKRAFEVIL